tara:strand:- start:18 stop:449 length:432 start_codon:yes stop_codon:yes gene_type:complete
VQFALARRGQPCLQFGRLPRFLLGELHQHRSVNAVDLKRRRAAAPIRKIGVWRTEAPNLLKILAEEIAADPGVEPVIGRFGLDRSDRHRFQQLAMRRGPHRDFAPETEAAHSHPPRVGDAAAIELGDRGAHCGEPKVIAGLAA